jgi:hypothetical protein
MNPDTIVSAVLVQLADPFRVGLMAALIYTTIRNAAVTGWFVPMAAGMVFVAFMIATLFPKAGETAFIATGTGLVANAVIAAVFFAGLTVWRRVSK